MIDDVIIKWLKEIYEAIKASSGGTVQNWTDFLDAPISGITGGGTLRMVKLISGSTWNHPADLNTEKSVRVFMVGGGASGGKGSSKHGGGYGGEILFDMPVFLTGASTAYSIGQGGAGKTTNGPGNAGGSTTFDSLTVKGGSKSAGSVSAPSNSSNPINFGRRLGEAAGGQGSTDSGTGFAGADSIGYGGVGTSGFGTNPGGGGASWGDGTDGNDDATAPGVGAGSGGVAAAPTVAGGNGMIIILYEGT